MPEHISEENSRICFKEIIKNFLVYTVHIIYSGWFDLEY